MLALTQRLVIQISKHLCFCFYVFLAPLGQKRKRTKEKEIDEAESRAKVLKTQLKGSSSDEGKPSMNKIGGYYVN